MKKVLIISTISGFVPQFEMNNVRLLQKLNYEVHYAANFKTPIYGIDNKRLENTGIVCHQIDFVRSPYNIFKHILAYKQLNKVVQEETISLIHCHTPVGGGLGRLVAKRNHIHVIYTAHGFHFYKGGPVLNWLIFYPIERYLSKYTDILVTINQEDYNLARSFNNCEIVKINGVGLNTYNFSNKSVNRKEKCKELGIEDTKFILCTVGELNKNKNHKVVLQALKMIKDYNIIYLICGNGNKINDLKRLSRKLGLNEKVKFLGHRTDINEILSVSDCFLFPSRREGLGMAALEAMSSGLPILVADSRGTREYAIEGKTGFVYKYNDSKGFQQGILSLYKNHDLRKKISSYNKIAALEFDTNNVSSQMEAVYKHFL